MKKIAFALALVSSLVVGGFFGAASATQPNPEHKVTICHATPADTAEQGWVSIEVDIASVGYQQQGHESEHDADIIPPYSYTDVDGNTFSYAGKGDQSILANGCAAVTPSPTPTETPTSPPPSPTTPPPSPSVSPTEQTPSPTVSPSVIPPTVSHSPHKSPPTVLGENKGPTKRPPHKLAYTGTSSTQLAVLSALALGLLIIGALALMWGRRTP